MCVHYLNVSRLLNATNIMRTEFVIAQSVRYYRIIETPNKINRFNLSVLKQWNLMATKFNGVLFIRIWEYVWEFNYNTNKIESQVKLTCISAMKFIWNWCRFFEVNSSLKLCLSFNDRFSWLDRYINVGSIKGRILFRIFLRIL